MEDANAVVIAAGYGTKVAFLDGSGDRDDDPLVGDALLVSDLDDGGGGVDLIALEAGHVRCVLDRRDYRRGLLEDFLEGHGGVCRAAGNQQGREDLF
ncbi:hypothetical protein [Saccharopolyspora griseoalba]|uniref:Uncharacterized protein n=1 Tax=Saccharopolyspora griseoalba TaxID=1431848 RepID=A0ABW2LSL2_9PSEU